MPTENNFPTPKDLNKFYKICNQLVELDRNPQQVPRQVFIRLKKDWLNLLKTFVFRQSHVKKVTNMVPMLQYVMENNQFENFSLLLGMVNDVNAKNSDGDTVLHLAAMSGSQKMLDEVLRLKIIDLNATNSHGNTVLHILSSSYDTQTVRYLIHKGVNINSVNLDRKSALHMATQLGNVTMVTVLLKFGADIFGMHGSIPAYQFIQNLMLDRPEDRRTHNLKAIEHMLKSVDTLVRSWVTDMDEKSIRDRNLAAMMCSHKHLGHASYLRNIDENILRMILKDSDSHHQGGVGMIELVHRKKLIEDAFALYTSIWDMPLI
jgi:hypothetical protein